MIQLVFLPRGTPGNEGLLRLQAEKTELELVSKDAPHFSNVSITGNGMATAEHTDGGDSSRKGTKASQQPALHSHWRFS